MDWELFIHKNPRYLEVITNGIADKDGSLKMSKAVAKNMRKHRITRALIDHRKIESLEGKIIDIYQRPGMINIINIFYKIKIAEIIKPEHTEQFKFLETVFINQGFDFSIFYEKEKAEKWLFK